MARKKTSRAGSGEVYQLKVTLDGSKPPIWRRILVPADASLGDLHVALQVAMGWTNSHMHMFEVGGRRFAAPGVGGFDLEAEDEDRATLAALGLAEKAKFRYEYDFGDDWRHTILVEKVGPAGPGQHVPWCLKGVRACPPEDCGGIWGYADFLEQIGDPENPEHDDMLDWVGGAFDPEAFDLDAVNKVFEGFR